MTFKIVSLNCWGGRLVKPLLPFIKNEGADVFCLQEMYSAPMDTPTPLVEKNAEELPAYPILYETLQNILPQYHGSFLPAAHGYLHDGATSEHTIRYGLATFHKSEHSLIAAKVGFVYSSFRYERWGEPPLPRNAHVIRIWRHNCNKAVVIAHMHGLWTPNGKMDNPIRIQQAKHLLELVRDISEQDDEIVVCGDFNVLPESKTFEILGELGLYDLVTTNGITDTRTSYYKKSPRYADYMLVSPNVKVLGFNAIPSPEVSDHRPLILEIE